jgi:hypothetical protein
VDPARWSWSGGYLNIVRKRFESGAEFKFAEIFGRVTPHSRHVDFGCIVELGKEPLFQSRASKIPMNYQP